MPAIDTDVNSVRRMFEVNLFGPMQMVHYFHDMLIRASGAIVNIGSIGGVVPYVYGGMILTGGKKSMTGFLTIVLFTDLVQASYNASKAALHHYSNTLRLEMSPFKYGCHIPFLG